MLFVNMNHELMHSLESLKHQEDGHACLNKNNFALDDCVIKVWILDIFGYSSAYFIINSEFEEDFITDT